MPKRFRLCQPDHALAVTEALATCQDVADQQRLLAMRLAASGQFTAAQIAEQLGISRRQFFNWVSALKEGGVAGLVGREHGGGPAPVVQGQVLAAFQAGLKVGRWKRAKEIQHWLRREHQVKLGLKGVYYWLGKLGGVLKVPRKAHAQKDAAQTVEFQQQLCVKLKNLNVAGGRPVRIWVTDEHRYGLIPVVRKCWTLRGERPTAPYQTKYEWGYLYSALEVDGKNDAQFLCLPRVDLAMDRMFLEHLAAERSSSGACGHPGSGGVSSPPGTPSDAGAHSCVAAAALQPGAQPGGSHRRPDQGPNWQRVVEDTGSTASGYRPETCGLSGQSKIISICVALLASIYRIK